MTWRESAQPVRMQRVALVAPQETLRATLVAVAGAGVVEVEATSTDETPTAAARALLSLHAAGEATPLLAPGPPDLEALTRDGRADLLAGEAELERRAEDAIRRDRVAALVGWCPDAAVDDLTDAVVATGGAVVPLPAPRGVDPPTLLRPGGQLHRTFAPLVQTYATVPYVDADPTLLAGLAYVVMFGMMFGDAGQGLLLVAVGLALRMGRPRRHARYRRTWPFLTAAGASATVFGVLYGEFFGPTGVLQPLWLDPLEEPVRLLVAAIGLGAVLLSLAYALGTFNRWREGGLRRALYAPSGIAGATLFLGLGLLAAGWLRSIPGLVALGAAVAVGGLSLAAVGLYAASPGGAAGASQAFVELFDLVIRLLTNVVSFARLAAFGLAHAALNAMIWDGATGLADRGPLGWLGAAAVLLVGNAVTFTLELLVAGIQALRLEYYELFSRVFDVEGRPFRPWHVPLAPVAADAAPAVPEEALR